MGQGVSLSEAKAHLAGLVQAAEAGDVVHISRHGRPVAVLLSEGAYRALQQQQGGPSLGAAIAHWRAAARPRQAEDWPVGPDEAGLREIQAWRDRSGGREVPLE